MRSIILRWMLGAVCWVVIVGSAGAAPVSIELKDASVAEFVALVFKGILKRDYLLGPGVGGNDIKITLSIAGVPVDELQALAVDTLRSHGVDVVESGNLLKFVRSGVSGVGSSPGATSWAATPGAIPGSHQIIPSGKDGPVVRPEDQVPEEIEVYFPKHRTVLELSEAVKLLGVKVASGKGSAVVFSGSSERAKLAREVIAKLDRAPGLVDVRAVVIEYSDTSEESHSFAGALSILGGKLGISLSAGSPGVNAMSFKDVHISAVLGAIEGDSRFRQLAEPMLRVLDGSKARIVVGSEFPVRGRVETDKGGNAVSSVEYKQAGIVLELAPQIMAKSVLVGIKQQVSSVALTTTSGIDSPTVNKREAETTIDALPGEMVIVGGLDDSREMDTRTGLSWLPRLLQGIGKSATRTQILLLLEVKRVVHL
ncbi:MAG: hypothetical protein Q7T21_02865 [Gallionella sp.]|nr:hypothetical protein [Gallionella sp.]